MSQQKYVQLNVELVVNGISCPISEEMFSSFLNCLDYFRYTPTHQSSEKNSSAELDTYQLSGDILSEIAKSRQTEHRKCVARYCYITKDVATTLLDDEQIDVIREVSENENVFQYLTAMELLHLVVSYNDIVITRNVASILMNDSKLSKEMQKDDTLMRLLLQNPDEEVRKFTVEFIVKNRLKSLKRGENRDPDLTKKVEESFNRRRKDTYSREEL